MHVTIFGCELDEAAVIRDQAPALGITPTITAAPVSASSITLAGGSRAISVGHKTRITNAHLAALRDVGVQYISSRSIGLNHIDTDFAASIGINVENVSYSPDSVADHTVMTMLMALRHAKAVVLSVNAHDYRLPVRRGRELRDLTVGVIGTGRIGSAVIDRLRGFGCEILASDERRMTSAEYVPLSELLRRSDVVTLHTPLDASTHHLLNAAALAQLRSGAVVVNTGRGGLIDTAALVTALESGALSGAALDVLEGEEGVFYEDRRHRHPDDTQLSRLHAMPNVILTPHTAFYTDHALNDTVVASLTNCLMFEKGMQHA